MTEKTEDPFEIARKNLHVQNIYLQKSETVVSEDLDRVELNSSAHICQYFNGCEKLTVLESNGDDDSDAESKYKYWYKFSYSAGVRLIKDVPDEEVSEDEVYVEIKATFDVFYASQIEISVEATDAFSKKNVQYHVWPFWREFVHSACGRIGVAPAIEIPSYLMARKASKGSEA